MASLLEHKVDDDKPHWMDFYSRYQPNIEMKEVRPNSRLAILNLHHKHRDDAPYVFFIHGACARMGQFESLIGHFSSKFNVVAFDRIGCGISHKPFARHHYDDSNIFMDLCSIFQQYIPQSSRIQNKKHEIIIVAHSFGCCQAIRLLCKFGNSSNYNYAIRSVILLAPPSLCLGESPGLIIRYCLFSLPHWILECLSARLSAAFRGGAIHQSCEHVHALERSFAGWNKPFMYTSFYQQLRPCSSRDLQLFASLNVNTLIIHGEHDKIAPVECAKRLKEEICKYKCGQRGLVKLNIMQHTSHQCMQEDAQTVYNTINTFNLQTACD